MTWKEMEKQRYKSMIRVLTNFKYKNFKDKIRSLGIRDKLQIELEKLNK